MDLSELLSTKHCKGRDAHDASFWLVYWLATSSWKTLTGRVSSSHARGSGFAGWSASLAQACGNENGDWKNPSPVPFPLNITAGNALLGVWRWKHVYLHIVSNNSIFWLSACAHHGSFNINGLNMAEFSPVLPPLRDDGGGGRYGQPLFPRSRSGSESDSELSQSLARTKTRSYGSTASVTAPLGEKYIEHRVTDGETLQGIALKYGVTVRI